jgi:hypothetical protein
VGNQPSKKPAVAVALLIFNPKDGSDMFLRNVHSHTDYTALYPEDGNIHNYYWRISDLKKTELFEILIMKLLPN